MYSILKERAARGETIRVALVGAGRMGRGIAAQLGVLPGLELAWVADIDPAAAAGAAQAYAAGRTRATARPAALPLTGPDARELLARGEPPPHVLVEATSTIGRAAVVIEQALEVGADVVLMNAEVDLAFGPWLREKARQHGRIVTSDAGDQHGVLARMIDEVRLWGLEIVMAGNIKGFLDRHATAASLRHEAAIRKLDPVQCCAYSDGTKLNIEMALVANGSGLLPRKPGMHGPRVSHVREALDAFDLEALRGGGGAVDYVLGAEPGGGVFVVAHTADALQRDLLQYYKMGDGPFYLYYRPCHLCSFETPLAIVEAVCRRRAILEPRHGRLADVYAHAKRDIEAGEPIPVAIGGDHCYGMIDRCATADAEGKVPIALLEPEGGVPARAGRRMRRDAPVRAADVILPSGAAAERFARVTRIPRA
jgi:predicted homoserine dehydrogenase-like protein